MSIDRLFAITLLGALSILASACHDDGGGAGKVLALQFLFAESRLDSSPLGSSQSYYQEISCDGNYTYVVWGDFRSHASNSDIYFNRSADGGRTWLAADVQLNTDGLGLARSIDPEICSAGNRVYVSWQDSRNGQDDVYFNFSTDNGATWQGSDIRLDTDLPGVGDCTEPVIACDGMNVFVAWEDNRNGLDDIRLNYSADGGVTWQPADIRLDTNLAGATESNNVELSFQAGVLYAVWEDRRNGSDDVYLNYSADGGATWGASDIRLDTDAPGVGDSDQPRIAAAGSRVYVAWYDDRAGSDDVYLNYSENQGLTWQPADIRINTDPAGIVAHDSVELAATGSAVYLVWHDNRNSAVNDDVYLNYSVDGGSTWLAEDIRLDTDPPGTGDSDRPTIALSGSTIYVAWRDDRNGQDDIHLNYSVDGGRTWQGADLRVTSTTPGSSESGNPRLCAQPSMLDVIWFDARDGLLDIYHRRGTLN